MIVKSVLKGRHDAQHNDIQHTNTQHKGLIYGIHHRGLIHGTEP
jgi:hypothetical protein